MLSNAGGMGVLAADVADEHGLVGARAVPGPPCGRLAEHVSGTTGTGNPVDAGAAATPDDLAAVADLVLGSDEVDALVVVLVATGVGDVRPVMDGSRRRARRIPDKPVRPGPDGRSDRPRRAAGRHDLRRHVRRRCASLGRAARYAAWRAHPRAAVEARTPERGERAAGPPSGCSRGPAWDGWLAAEDITDLLTDYDFAPEGRVVARPGRRRDGRRRSSATRSR